MVIGRLQYGPYYGYRDGGWNHISWLISDFNLLFVFSFCILWDKFDTVAQAGMEVTHPIHEHTLLVVPNCALSYRTEASGNLKEVEVLNSEEPPRD